MTNYLEKDVQELNKLLKNKIIKPINLVNEAFAKIESSNLNAFITLNKEQAIKTAIELENKEVDNLLFGMPIVIKDNIITKDLRTTCASKMLEDFIPPYDATVIKKIKEAHMIIIGKSNMDEFAMGSTGATSYFGPTLNPWNKNLVPGGSSSGSATAIASRFARFSLGSDTGGSIRQPSSFCGVVGLKPTYGRVSRYGLVAFASSLDQIGPLTPTVMENALLLNLISGYDENDYTSSKEEIDFLSDIEKDIKGMKIAIPNFYINDQVNNEIKDNINKIIELLKEKGCLIDYIDMDYLEYSIPLYQIIALAEASSNLARFDGIKYGYQSSNQTDLMSFYKMTRYEGFGTEVKRRIMIGSYVLSGENANTYYKKALIVRKKLSDEFNQVFKNYDLMIGPVNTSYAYPLNTKKNDALKSFYDDLLTIPVNMAGLPALSLPIGFSKEKLPIGMHIIGPHFKENIIYKLAYNLEKHLNLDLNPKGGK